MPRLVVAHRRAKPVARRPVRFRDHLDQRPKTRVGKASDLGPNTGEQVLVELRPRPHERYALAVRPRRPASLTRSSCSRASSLMSTCMPRRPWAAFTPGRHCRPVHTVTPLSLSIGFRFRFAIPAWYRAATSLTPPMPRIASHLAGPGDKHGMSGGQTRDFSYTHVTHQLVDDWSVGFTQEGATVALDQGSATSAEASAVPSRGDVRGSRSSPGFQRGHDGQCSASPVRYVSIPRSKDNPHVSAQVSTAIPATPCRGPFSRRGCSHRFVQRCAVASRSWCPPWIFWSRARWSGGGSAGPPSA